MTRYEVREYTDADEPALLAAHTQAFGEHARGRDRAAWWKWAQRDNPAGTRVLLALEGDQVIAQVAALPLRQWLDGREEVFAQLTDVFLARAERVRLKAPGALVTTARQFAQTFGGPDGDVLHFGWPGDVEWRVAKELLKADVVRTQCVLAHPTHDAPSWAADPAAAPAGVETCERFDEQARWLWERCCGAWGASTIRDDAFLNWRFVEHPLRDYTIFGVRDDERILRGYAVYRRVESVARRTGVVVDWLVPTDEVEVGEQLQRALVDRAHADGCAELRMVLPDWSPWFETLQRWGFRVRQSDYRLAGRGYARKYDMFWLRANWWYTFADGDLF